MLDYQDNGGSYWEFSNHLKVPSFCAHFNHLPLTAVFIFIGSTLRLNLCSFFAPVDKPLTARLVQVNE